MRSIARGLAIEAVVRFSADYFPGTRQADGGSKVEWHCCQEIDCEVRNNHCLGDFVSD